MIIKIKFFKPSGKYYTEGNVEIPNDSYLWTDGIEDVIAKNQKEVSNPFGFIWVTENTDDSLPPHDNFFLHLWDNGHLSPTK